MENKYAVIKIAGGQLLVEEGQKYEIQKISGNVGDIIINEEVLLIVDGDKVEVGKPNIKGAKVEMLFVEAKKGEKIEGFKYKAKARYQKHFGSRQSLSIVEIKKISY
ncbi:MAG TPA: 50S ribosomal protein L21 [Candidatus Dojkabacteria bacterium]|nr:50S ribosomal protein L21 [Candidatus Dojkabacteria bacterium]